MTSSEVFSFGEKAMKMGGITEVYTMRFINQTIFLSPWIIKCNWFTTKESEYFNPQRILILWNSLLLLVAMVTGLDGFKWSYRHSRRTNLSMATSLDGFMLPPRLEATVSESHLEFDCSLWERACCSRWSSGLVHQESSYVLKFSYLWFLALIAQSYPLPPAMHQKCGAATLPW